MVLLDLWLLFFLMSSTLTSSFIKLVSRPSVRTNIVTPLSKFCSRSDRPDRYSRYDKATALSSLSSSTISSSNKTSSDPVLPNPFPQHVEHQNIEQNKTSMDINRTWDINGLKAEVNRAYLRTFKKIGNTNEKLQKGLKILNEIVETESPSEELFESCPDVDKMKLELGSDSHHNS